jgi:site-specific DNA-methyltransferase (adenine-specific)
VDIDTKKDDYILILGDCISEMRKIESSSVDLIVADMPYGTTRNKWDSVIDLKAMWDEISRICTGRSVFTSSQPFTTTLIGSNPKLFKHEWIWHKNRSTGSLNANVQPMKAHESILVFGRGKYNAQKTYGHKPVSRFYTRDHGDCYGSSAVKDGGGSTERYPRSVQYFKCERGIHPTQKPVELMEYIIKTYSDKGDMVMDFCMGSGTTGVACKNTGRRFIGIEKGGRYFELAKNRINNHI